jgi:thymidylate kinase
MDDARAGQVVIFDRFPLACLSNQREHRLFDGPQIASVLGVPTGRVMRTLAEAEARLYAQFRLPDRLIVLTVEPEVAATRKPDHEREVLLTKCRAMGTLVQLAESIESAEVARLDANRSTDAVLSDVKSEVWDAI